LDNDPEFQKLDRRKRELLESETEQSYVDADDLRQIKENAVETAIERQRREAIQRLNKSDGISQTEIADAFGITQSRVSQIVNS